MLTPSRGTPRNDRGDNLLGLVIVMFVFALLVPGLLMLLTRSQQLATTNPDWDEGIQARAELAELFGSVDPIGQCASPVGGPDAAFRDTCFREERLVGASLIRAPSLPAAESPVACWLTVQETGTRQRKCLVLEGGSDELECVNPPPVGPCLEVLSEVTDESVMVDRFGGGRFLVRSWDEEPTDPCFQREVQRLFNVSLTVDVPDHPFLPSPACFSEASVSDRLIYTDVEWVCMRWRHPYRGDRNRDGDTDDPGEWAAHEWLGECPDPTDPTENWPAGAGLPLPATSRVELSGTQIVYAHRVGDRISDVEVLVCVASDQAARLQGAAHCTVDVMRLTVTARDGQAPPIPVAPAIVLRPDIAENGLTVLEGDTLGAFLPVKLLAEPSTDVLVTVSAPSGIAASPPSLTFIPTNWNISQGFRVTAADDPDRDDETATVTLTTASADADYDGLTTTVDVTVTDDDAPHLRVNTGTLTVGEDGTGTFTVTLKGQPPPSGEVTATVASSDPSALTVPSTPLTFATSETAQTVTISGVSDDDGSDEFVSVTLTTSATLATDVGDYGGLTASVAVTVTDDETAALELSVTKVTVDEGGTTPVDVTLATQPAAPVTVNISSANTAAATADPSTLTFTASDWNIAQTVTITGTSDADFDDTSTTLHLAANSTDTDYQGGTATVPVAVTDDDMPELVITPTAIVIPDDSGHGAQFTVNLSSPPSADVTVTIGLSDAGLLTNPSTSLMFSPTTWDAPQTISVTAGGGLQAPTGDHTQEAVTLAASDGDYDGVTNEAAVYVVDNEDHGTVHPIVGVLLITDWSAPGPARNLRLTCDVPNGTVTLSWARPEQPWERTEAGYEVSGSDSNGTSVAAITRRETAARTVDLGFVPQGTLTVTVTSFNFHRDNLARQDSNPLTSDLTC